MKIEKLKIAPGSEIRIRDSEGTGTACMLLHDESQSLKQFDEQFNALGEKFRLIAWDYPDHGGSNAFLTPLEYSLSIPAEIGFTLDDLLKDPIQDNLSIHVAFGFSTRDMMNSSIKHNIPSYAALGLTILKHLGINSVSLFGWSLGGYVAIEMINAWQTNLNSHLKINGLMIKGISSIFFPTEERILPALATFPPASNEDLSSENEPKWAAFSRNIHSEAKAISKTNKKSPEKPIQTIEVRSPQKISISDPNFFRGKPVVILNDSLTVNESLNDFLKKITPETSPKAKL